MTARSQLSEIRRELLEQLKEEAKRHIGPIPPSLRRYYQDYKEEFRRFRRASSKEELLARVRRSALVLIGDYHALDQAQKTSLAIVRAAAEAGRVVRLGLEMVHSHDQRLLDRFLAGKAGEEEFLEGSRYAETWGFSWESHRQLLEYARRRRLPVHGLNVEGGAGGPGLRKRDRHAARIIARLVAEHPQELLIVVYGDLHLASGHLPAEIGKRLAAEGVGRLAPLIVYQNSETIFWKLHRRRQREVDVVRLRRDAYCVINATPWVKLQSYIFWERNRRDLLCNLHRFIHPGAAVELPNEVDCSDQVLTLIRAVAEFFHVRAAGLDSFSVLTLADLPLVLRSLRRLRRFPILRALILQEESLFIPERRMIFLRFPDLHHASEQGTLFLYWLKTSFDPQAPEGQDEFYRRVLRRALGFLGSLVINPKRKHWHRLDHRRFVESMIRRRKRTAGERRQLEVSRLVLRHLEREEQRLGRGHRRPAPPPVLLRGLPARDRQWAYQLSSSLGQILGAEIYRGLLEGRLRREEVGLLFERGLGGRKEALDLYLQLKRRLFRRGAAAESKSDVF